MTASSSDQEPRYAKYLSRIIRPSPDFDFFFIKRVRDKAVGALQVGPGARVLDLGCGSGGSFPYLVKAVGSSGTVVGVDISPQSCINARRRIKSNGWHNVTVLEAAAEKVELTGIYDGVLMFAAPDVFASESALGNVLPHLREHAGVAIFGAKLSDRRFGKVLNPLLRFLFSSLSPYTPLPDRAPWSLLGKHVVGLHIQVYFFGSMFLAYGTIKQPAQAPDDSSLK